MQGLRAIIGVSALWASGCVIGFDAGTLTGGTGGGNNSGAADLAGNASNSTGNGADTPDMAPASSACINFGAYADGTPLPNWVDGKGTWRVAATAAGKALTQTTAAVNRSDIFVGWQGGKDYADVSISAVANLGNMTDMNCVLARVQDSSNYYSLCVNESGGRHGPLTHEWRVNVMSAGTETQLGTGTIAVTASHTFTLRVQAGTLYPSVDGAVQLPVTDATFTHGFAGVRTDDQGGFMSLCTVGL
jgi:hypothetical protein